MTQVQNTIATVKANATAKIAKLTEQLEMMQGILVNCNWIVECGALTFTTDDNGVVILANKTLPTMFTRKAAEEISTMKVTGDKKPQIWLAQDWYKKEIEATKEVLSYFE